ncbi:hypothetical protein K7432_006479 [Basidiobolus ranarum]|uniref:Uncharacterized protein n=1 Tax=Basidiobolus ranarum TaxID=34480 RepID=A0ABR2W1I5_9FUNG
MDPTNPAYNNFRFANNRNVRDSFIALFTFWIIWALLLLADHGMGLMPVSNAVTTNTPDNTNATTTPGNNTRQLKGSKRNVTRAQKVARNVFITMLWMLTASTLGFGLTRGSMILTWIYFVVGVMWVLIDLVIANSIIDFVFGSMEFVLALAVMGIGFSKGW